MTSDDRVRYFTMTQPAFVRSPLYACSKCARRGARLWVARDAPELFCALHRPAARDTLPAVPLLCTGEQLALFVDTRAFCCAAWHALAK